MYSVHLGGERFLNTIFLLLLGDRSDNPGGSIPKERKQEGRPLGVGEGPDCSGRALYLSTCHRIYS
jgi:hypothetical protein